MHILVTGATGMAGAEVLRQAIADPEISAITTLSRKEQEIRHPKINPVIHSDFKNYAGLEHVFKAADACLWCLGISQSQVTKENYNEITFDYAITAADAMLKANPFITFVFLSGAGADQTEKSRTIFARVKGKTENALMKMPFKKLLIARPAGIRPIHRNKNTALLNKLVIPLFPLLEFISPGYVINSVQLARAMIHIAKHDEGIKIYENRELKTIAGSEN